MSIAVRVVRVPHCAAVLARRSRGRTNQRPVVGAVPEIDIFYSRFPHARQVRVPPLHAVVPALSLGFSDASFDVSARLPRPRQPRVASSVPPRCRKRVQPKDVAHLDRNLRHPDIPARVCGAGPLGPFRRERHAARDPRAGGRVGRSAAVRRGRIRRDRQRAVLRAELKRRLQMVHTTGEEQRRGATATRWFLNVNI